MNGYVIGMIVCFVLAAIMATIKTFYLDPPDYMGPK